MTIYWTAANNSSFLNGSREAKTMLAAVRAGRKYVENELNGEGKITFSRCEDVAVNPDRIDEKTVFTDYKWVTVDI